MALPYDAVRAVRDLKKADPEFAVVITTVGPCRHRLRTPKDPFRALFRSIIYQQLAGAAAGAIETRVLDLFDGRRPSPAALQALTDSALRGAGLSRQKITYCRDLADHALRGHLPTARGTANLDNDEIIARCTAVKGVGRWTVEMMLMSHLGRPDVLPVDDYGIRKGFMVFKKLDEMPRPGDVAAYGERWAPWRSVASWYLWRWAHQDF